MRRALACRLLVDRRMEIFSLPRAPRYATATDKHLARLESLIAVADVEGPVDNWLALQVRGAFGAVVRTFDSDLRSLDSAGAAALIARTQDVLMPVMRRSEHGWRWYEKPRGYAGDFATIARMYDNHARGEGVDRLIDRCFLDFPAVIAVQNRRGLLAEQISKTLKAGPARITSLACGPAREVFDAFAKIDPNSLEVTLVDFDREALAYCRAEQTARDLAERIKLVEANLIHVAVGRRALELPPQDLIYSIGLIDYLNDDLVVALLDWIYDQLRPGGRALLGNFHPANPTRAIMDHLLDWKLIHRDEADMNRLAQRSNFAAGCSAIHFEDQRINLFAELIR